MGTIYRSRCSNCDATATFSGSCLAVQLGKIQINSSLPKGRIVRLRHPGESSRLKKLGFTIGQAALEGRLFRFLQVLCTECGTRFEQRRFVPPHSGLVDCLVPISLATSVAFVAYSAWQNVVLGLLAFATSSYVAFSVWGFAINRRRLSRYSRRIAEIEGPVPCPRCDGQNHVPVSSQVRNHPCSVCGQYTVSVIIWGKS